MIIIIEGVEPQFKVYKMSESIDNKFYIGKTKQPLRIRMNGNRSSGDIFCPADKHFADVGWRNVTVEIIDTANDEKELLFKEREHILRNVGPLMLNKKIYPVPQYRYIRKWSDEKNEWLMEKVEWHLKK